MEIKFIQLLTANASTQIKKRIWLISINQPIICHTKRLFYFLITTNYQKWLHSNKNNSGILSHTRKVCVSLCFQREFCWCGALKSHGLFFLLATNQIWLHSNIKKEFGCFHQPTHYFSYQLFFYATSHFQANKKIKVYFRTPCTVFLPRALSAS